MLHLSKTIITFALSAVFLLGIIVPITRAETPAVAGFGVEKLKLNVAIGNLNDFSFNKDKVTCEGRPGSNCYSIPWLGQYLVALYRYALIVGSLAAVVSFIIGGFGYMLAGVNKEILNRSKSFMKGSVVGIVILLSSYLMLDSINPNLVSFKPLQVEVVKGSIVPPTFCEDIAEGKHPSGRKYTDLILIEPNDKPPTGQDAKKFGDANMNCGDKFPVKLNPGAGNDYMMMDGSSCVSARCNEPQKVCANMRGKWKCVDPLVYGSIDTVYDTSLLIRAWKAITKGDFVALTDGVPISITDVKLIDRQTKAQLGTPNLSTDNYAIAAELSNPPVGEYVLEVGVLTEGMTWDSAQSYYVDKTGQPVSIAPDGTCYKYSCDKGVLSYSANCEYLRGSEMSSATRPKVSLSVSKFFCENDGRPLSVAVDSMICNKYGKTVEPLSSYECEQLKKGKADANEALLNIKGR